MNILIKEHFNRWYSLKMYYSSVTLIDIPLSVSFLYYYSIYFMNSQTVRDFLYRFSAASSLPP